MKYRIMALLLIMGILNSCAAGTSESNTEQTTVAAEETTEAVTERVPAPTHLPEVDYTGKTFTILYCGEENPYILNDLLSDGTNGEIINDTVYERNLKLEAKYGVTLAGIPKNEAYLTAKQEILGGNASFDIICDQMVTMQTLAAESYFQNWYSLQYFDPSLAWWDTNAAKELSIGGNLYMMSSDIVMSTSASARFLFINKTLAGQYGLEIPYDLVREGNWTWDKFTEMVMAVSTDLNGDGKMTGEDRFGLFTEHDEYFLVGCGLIFTDKNADDMPVLAVMNEKSVTAVVKLKELFDNKKNTISFLEASKGADTSAYANYYDYCRGLFVSDHALFIQNGAAVTVQFTNMESEYGILPNPKLDESQKSYYHLVDQCSCAWAIPTTNSNTEMLDVLMNYWGYLSSNSLVDAFYETTVKYKRLNAPDDTEMLDVVRSTIRYELATIMDIGILGLLDDSVKNGDLASNYEKNRKKYEKNLEKLINNYTDN